MDFTTIRISKRNKKRLDEMGKKCETHDEIVEKVLNSLENIKKKNKK